MKDIKIKYSLIALSYLISYFFNYYFLCINYTRRRCTYIRKYRKLIKEEKNNFLNNENTVYEILEKKEKSIEDIIEKELENRQKVNLENN